MLGGVEKHSLKFKHERNGLFLKIHHTVESETNEMRKIRFKIVDICISNEIFAAVDETDNIFLFNLREKCFWQLTEVSIPNILTIKFVPTCFNITMKNNNPKKYEDDGYSNSSSSNLLIGNKSGFIYEIEITNGRVLRCIRVFASNEINQLLCCSLKSSNAGGGRSSSCSCFHHVLASTTNQIKIYEYDKLTKKSEFSFRNELRIKFIKWMPYDDKILAILRNDIICVFGWDGSILKLIRRYDPLKAREKFLRKSNHRIEMLKYVGYNDNNECNDHKTSRDENSESTSSSSTSTTERDSMQSKRTLSSTASIVDMKKDKNTIKSVTRDYQNGIITDVTFQANISTAPVLMIVALMDNTIILISTMMWDVRRVIAYPDFYIKQCQFIPHMNGKNVLLTLTSNDDLMLTCMNGNDEQQIHSRMLIDMNNFTSFVLSTNGRLLVNVHRLGELLAYNLENHLNDLMMIKNSKSSNIMNEKKMRNDVGSNSTTVTADDERRQLKMNKEMLLDIQMKIAETMPRERLLPILREFTEYPEKYRIMMWKTLLKLPGDCKSFTVLLKQNLISSVSYYDKRFPLVDHKALSNLKQIVSCLIHWTPVFENVKYLPKFVFPFVKMSKGDLLFAFELITTLLLNHCQLWFEFLPSMDVPYNYLNLVENVLMEMDKKLYEFYQSKGITAQQYAMPLMETAFSEVLDQSMWLQLWDHIVTFEAPFMIFAIVAFNSIHRNVIMECDDIESVEKFFHEQNFIDIKKLVKKAENCMKKCSSDINPMHYMTPFTPLALDGKRGYRKFENYQRHLINKNISDLHVLREEQKELDEKLDELAKFEKSMEKRFERYLIDEEHAKRLKEVEEKFHQALEEEEQRIIYQRKLLLLNTKKLREKEIETIIRMKNTSLRNSVAARERDLEVMLRAIEKQRLREEIEMQMAHENLKLKEVALEMKALNAIESDNNRISGSYHVPLEKKYKDMLRKLGEQHKKFMDELGQIEPTSLINPTSQHNGSNAINTGNSEASLASEEATTYRTFSERDVQHDDVDAFERAFQEIREEYKEYSGKETNKDDYRKHMKNLGDKMKRLEYEITSLLTSMKGF